MPTAMLPSGKLRGPSPPGRGITHPHSGSYGLLAEGSLRYPTISVPCLGEANSVRMRISRSPNSGSSYSRSTGFRGSRAINSRGIAVNLPVSAPQLSSPPPESRLLDPPQKDSLYCVISRIIGSTSGVVNGRSGVCRIPLPGSDAAALGKAFVAEGTAVT